MNRHSAGLVGQLRGSVTLTTMMMYSVELYKRLAARLAPHPLRYLRGAGDAGPGPRWRAFMEALRTQVQGDEQVAEACAGACDAFDRILALAELNGSTAPGLR